ncbi:5-oxoprolinase subunit PxpA [Colwelliaceae bacterium BS250]
MKLNCDLGEYALTDANCPDALVMPFIDMANIACGYHAGCEKTMHNTVVLAVKHNVQIGAHPSYDDKENFGRVSQSLNDGQIMALMATQLKALSLICAQHDTSLSYVKPHGALYNDMMQSEQIFRAICKSIAAFSSNLPLMIQAVNNQLEFQNIADEYNLSLIFEAFADRNYQVNGLLVPRSEPNAVLHDVDDIIRRCKQLIIHQELQAINGKVININANSLCVHGDNTDALAMVKALRAVLNDLHE